MALPSQQTHDSLGLGDLSKLSLQQLSIRQPWARLIFDGHKKIENRDWRPSHHKEKEGRWIAIQVSQTIEKKHLEGLDYSFAELSAWVGHIVGV